MEADLTPPSGERYRALSLWWDGLPGSLTVRPPLPGDLEVDVAVVGGGLTGLWTAYYLHRADPGLRIAVFERDVTGFGASGRNGGWCSALFSVSEATLDRTSGPGAGTAQRLAMEETVREVGRVVDAEGIDCGYRRGGTVVLARTPAQLERTHEEVADARRRGIGEEDLAFLPADEARRRVGATDVLGGHLHAALRRRRPRPPRARPGLGGRASVACRSTSAPRSAPSPPGRSPPTGARSGPAPSCAPRRATPVPWPVTSATSCPSTR